MRVGASAPITRRDFFLVGSGRRRTLNVSCQRFYMTFVEATNGWVCRHVKSPPLGACHVVKPQHCRN